MNSIIFYFQCHRCTDGPSAIPSISNLKLQHHRMERNSNLSDDEPLYDAVASDDDYATLTPTGLPTMHQQVMHLKTFKMNSIG